MHTFFKGFIVGGICASIPFGFIILTSSHHYKEHDSTLIGNIGKDKIQNISFFEYTGLGFLELNKWKIVLNEDLGDSIILYERQSAFQERIPHRPVVEIQKDGIKMQDGDISIRMIIEKMKTTEPNQALEPTTMAVTPPAAQEPRQP